MTVQRRRFLQGVGGLLVAAPLLDSLRSEASAQPAAPQRVALFFTRNGCVTNRWFPTVEDGPLTSADLRNTTLAPLWPYADKLLLPRGLRSVNGYGAPQLIDPHDQVMASKLTCAPVGEGADRYPTSHSFDHEIARQVGPTGTEPLVLSVGANTNDIKSVLSFSAPETAYPSARDPIAVFAQFTGLVAGSEPPDTAHALMEEAIVDSVRDDLQRFARHNLGQQDRQRIEIWAELLHQTQANVLDTRACTAASPAEVGLPTDGEDPEFGDDSSLGIATDAMLNLMALSMVCDTHRALIFDNPGYVTFGEWANLNHAHDAAALANRTGDASVEGECLPNVLQQLLEIDNWYADKFTQLVALLDSIPEGRGTLLDNTATVWLPEFSDGAAKNVNNLPIVVAGSAGGYLKQAAAVNLDSAELSTGDSEAGCLGTGTVSPGLTGTDPSLGTVPINKLYVTLMNAVGCTSADGGPLSSFGIFDGDTIEDGITSPGELEALRA